MCLIYIVCLLIGIPMIGEGDYLAGGQWLIIGWIALDCLMRPNTVSVKSKPPPKP